MEFTGKVAGITMDFMSGKYNISFQADSADAVTSQFDGIKDAEFHGSGILLMKGFSYVGLHQRMQELE